MMPSATILLVDDDLAVLSSLKLWLEEEHYHVIGTRNQREALEKMKSEHPNLCIVDLHLEEDDGIQLAEKLSAQDPKVPILILTAYPSYETATKALKNGVFDYLAKSSENETLLNRIQLALEENILRSIDKTPNSNAPYQLIALCRHPTSLTSIRAFCRENSEFRLLNSLASMEDLHRISHLLSPDLLLICEKCFLDTPDSCQTTLDGCRSSFPQARTLVLNSSLSQEKMQNQFYRGVKGFLPHDVTFKKMKKALTKLLEGGMWVSRELSDRLLTGLLDNHQIKTGGQVHNPGFSLTEREVDILRSIASGLSNFEISEQLFISEKTVKTHINNIFKKMKVKSRTHAVIKALEHRLF